MRQNSPQIMGPLCILLSLGLMGCGATLNISKPPAELLYDCPIPAMRARTNGELAATARALHGALVMCNIDKAALRDWAKED